MLKLSLEHKKPFSCELHINNKKQEISKNLAKHFFKIIENACNIKIFINPYKIKPLIRIKGKEKQTNVVQEGTKQVESGRIRS